MNATIERKATDNREQTVETPVQAEKSLTWDRAVEKAICGY